MDSVKYASGWEEIASRIELVVRWVWAVPLYIGVVILALISSYIVIPLQFLHVLLLGKRHFGFSNFLHNYTFTHAINYMSYLLLITDERPPLLPASMVNVRLDYVFSEPASRLELLVRLLYLIPLAIVASIMSLFVFAGWVLQTLLVLLIGRRNRQIWDLTAMWLRYIALLQYYACMQTDERPPIMPQ